MNKRFFKTNLFLEWKFKKKKSKEFWVLKLNQHSCWATIMKTDQFSWLWRKNAVKPEQKRLMSCIKFITTPKMFFTENLKDFIIFKEIIFYILKVLIPKIPHFFNWIHGLLSTVPLFLLCATWFWFKKILNSRQKLLQKCKTSI